MLSTLLRTPVVLSAILIASALVAPRLCTAATATTAPAGPGGVLEMHRRLFAALDRWDLETATAVLDEDGGERRTRVFLDDTEGDVVAGEGRADAALALKRWATVTGSETRVLAEHAECESPRLSYAVIEFERTFRTTSGTGKVVRYRSTSLVRHLDDGSWKLFHWHVSKAGETPLEE